MALSAAVERNFSCTPGSQTLRRTSELIWSAGFHSVIEPHGAPRVCQPRSFAVLFRDSCWCCLSFSSVSLRRLATMRIWSVDDAPGSCLYVPDR